MRVSKFLLVIVSFCIGFVVANFDREPPIKVEYVVITVEDKLEVEYYTPKKIVRDSDGSYRVFVMLNKSCSLSKQ